MKVCILYQFKDGPYGGANQFLKALREYFEAQGCYEEEVKKADVVLYNSSNETQKVLEAKKHNQNCLFVQRMDGPSSLHMQKKDQRDYIARSMNRFVADATVFQSEYSREANRSLGLCKNTFETTIHNAPDQSVFWSKEKASLQRGKKVRLIASSWSGNMSKGFKTYQYLDKHLDFEKYEMYFIGNSPVSFHNIKVIGALPSEKLADMIRGFDIYITASQKESCSNSLLEAMFCGLPAVALRDGGNPELIGAGGELFDKCEEIPALIEKICNNYTQYQSGIALENMNQVGKRYYDFLSEICQKKHQGMYAVKHLSRYGVLCIRLRLLKMKIVDRCKKLFIDSRVVKNEQR
ncbi:MAG: glycosyltransferase family 4 protein [Lachnospiraceae bacterium]|nr:glycosyltransferase family 4 protein [Lachnospiraceae bacterium]